MQGSFKKIDNTASIADGTRSTPIRAVKSQKYSNSAVFYIVNNFVVIIPFLACRVARKQCDNAVNIAENPEIKTTIFSVKPQKIFN